MALSKLRVVSQTPPKIGSAFPSRYSNEELMAARLSHCNIPKRFEESCFDNFTPKCAESKKALDAAMDYVQNFEQHLTQGKSLMFSGSVGAGKTHLACAIIKAIIEGHPKRTGFYTTSYNLIQSVKSTWSDRDGPSERKVMERSTKPSLLVIDEIGAHQLTDSDKAIIFNAINERYENVKPTLIISNMNVEGIKLCLGDRTYDRLREGGGRLISFTWPTNRK